jgi:hypothetical protein
MVNGEWLLLVAGRLFNGYLRGGFNFQCSMFNNQFSMGLRLGRAYYQGVRRAMAIFGKGER